MLHLLQAVKQVWHLLQRLLQVGQLQAGQAGPLALLDRHLWQLLAWLLPSLLSCLALHAEQSVQLLGVFNSLDCSIVQASTQMLDETMTPDHYGEM